MAKTYISEHFTLEECTCSCGCGYHGYPAAVVALAEKIRQLLGLPMQVHCVARCKKHNVKVGGSKTSQHLTGHAMDFHVVGMSHKDAHDKIIAWYKACQLPDLGGIGLYDWGIHIDTKVVDHLRTWDYRGHK